MPDKKQAAKKVEHAPEKKPAIEHDVDDKPPVATPEEEADYIPDEDASETPTYEPPAPGEGP